MRERSELVNEDKLRKMLKDLQAGKKDVDDILESLRSWPYEDLGAVFRKLSSVRGKASPRS